MDQFVWDYCPNCDWFGKIGKACRFCWTCDWELLGWGRRKVVLRLEAKAPAVAPLQMGSPSRKKKKKEEGVDEVEEILKGHKVCVTGT